MPRPGGEAEDDGVLLSLVSPGAGGRGHLLVLDARTWQEAARVELPVPVPYRFHGAWLADA